MNTLLLPPVLGVVGMLAAALVVYMLVMKYSDGEDKVKKIGDQIHAGALAFMKTEYKYLTIFIGYCSFGMVRNLDLIQQYL